MPFPDTNPYRDGNGAPKLRPSVAAFIDLLGYKDFIREISKDRVKAEKELIRLRSALDEAYKFLKLKLEPESSDDPVQFQVRTFTDSLIIGYPFPDHSNESWAKWRISTVIDYIGYFQAQMARDGYFVRGGISVGELYVDEDIVFGPALLEAYEAEKALAIFPRVILCPSAKAAFAAHGQGDEVFDVLIDSDGQVFVDYLENTVMIAYPDDRPFTEFLEGHKVSVLANLEKFAKKPNIKNKYDWVANYHNSFCHRHQDVFDDNDKIADSLLTAILKVWIPNPRILKI